MPRWPAGAYGRDWATPTEELAEDGRQTALVRPNKAAQGSESRQTSLLWPLCRRPGTLHTWVMLRSGRNSARSARGPRSPPQRETRIEKRDIEGLRPRALSAAVVESLRAIPTPCACHGRASSSTRSRELRGQTAPTSPTPLRSPPVAARAHTCVGRAVAATWLTS